MDIKVNINTAEIMQKLEKKHQKAQFAMSQQALKDCNYYCKQDHSNLISSSDYATDFEKGVLRWQTPYARMQYYLDATCTDTNDHAQKMWAHKAASEHKEDWAAVYKKVFEEE